MGDQCISRRFSDLQLLFAVASAIIALSGAQAPLLAGRALQGLAAAIAVPSTLAAVNAISTGAGQAQAIAAWTVFLMLGFSIGPFVGGAFTHFIGWRAIFWFNIPLMVLAVAGLALTPVVKPQVPGTFTGGHDWIGFILLATVMTAVVCALHALPDIGVAPAPVVGLVGLALIGFWLLFSVERRAIAPLIDLTPLQAGTFLLPLSGAQLVMALSASA